MFRYEIADLVLNITCKNSTIIRQMNPFYLSEKKNADLNITLESMDYIDIPKGSIISEENIKWLRKSEGQNGYYLYNTEKKFGKLLTLADIDSAWQYGNIKYLNNENKTSEHNYKMQTEIYIHVLIGVMFRYCLLNYNGIVIHASALEWRGKGVLFSAPSGTGKSTHTKLWQEYIGDEVRVLNDDTPAIKFRDNQLYVFGTPWSGSSQIHCNGSAPLEAIILLEQSEENRIQMLSSKEAIKKLMPRVFLPYFDQKMMAIALDIFEKVISKVPVYLLRCRPDREAVELTYQCLK